MIELINKLTTRIHAGKISLDPTEMESTLSDIFKLIDHICAGNNYFTNRESQLKTINIFENLTRAGLSEALMEKVDAELFYRFGSALLDDHASDGFDTKIIYEYLNLFRSSKFLIRLSEDIKWERLILGLINKSDYTTRTMFFQRTRDYPGKTLFTEFSGGELIKHSWENVSAKVEVYAKAFLSLLSRNMDKEIHCAFILENSLTMALLDITCLVNGIINVMIPANSVAEHIEFILNETKAPVVFANDEKQLAKIKSIKSKLAYCEIVVLVNGSSSEKWVENFENFLKYPAESSNALTSLHERNVSVDKLATIMYTSGTTGDPKGIMFSHRNIIYKRFCRALAIPAIGENDRFLAYLPLFHTFGRYLEMMGCMFWAAEYIFMKDPSPQTMISNMQRIKPTVFISIPKKWLQLFEFITAKLNIEIEPDDAIRNILDDTTGGQLKWGLSAAGFLPSEVFTFFQYYGIELMSGFGMTEATGGITMTPPGRFKVNSLGKNLPGISIKLAADGELLIKGDYVMMGYFNQAPSEVFDDEGWFPTGDIMVMDDDSFIQIIDRKKEIYKNIKGETVAPQKIENLFKDFVTVKQVFLVGDHRPFNTALIFPNYEEENYMLDKMNEEDKIKYFSSIVVTVNNFLAPFERIVDFRIISRPFSDEFGELTTKGTYKRRVIEKNFENEIDSMYQKPHVELIVDDLELRIPNWFLREKSSLSGDIVAIKDGIAIPKLNISLCVKTIDKTRRLVRVGDFIYKLNKRYVDFQSVFTSPEVWLGNKSLVDFTGDAIVIWQRQFTDRIAIEYDSCIKVENGFAKCFDELVKFLNGNEISTAGLHEAAILLQSINDDQVELAVKYFNMVLIKDEFSVHSFAVEILKRPNLVKSKDGRRKLFKMIANLFSEQNFQNYLKIYLSTDYDLINEDLINSILNSGRKPDKLDALLNLIQYYFNESAYADDSVSPLPSLIKLIGLYGIQHPSTYERVRQVLAEIQLRRDIKNFSGYAAEARVKLREGFRNWIGPNQTVAVDLETGDEYTWEDVITFEEGIDEEDLARMKNAIIKLPVIREAVFLFSRGKIITLNNLLTGSIWVSILRSYHNKTVYRITVQTRFQGSFDLVLNLNKGRKIENVKDEINLLILAGSRKYIQERVEDFGGYWEEYDLWSGKFVPGDPVEKLLLKESRKTDFDYERKLYNLWPFFVWNASAAYFNFWRLTAYKFILADPSTSNFIIPPHDYQTGTKVISLSEKIQFKSLMDMFRNFHSLFIEAAENKYPFLKNESVWSFVFSGLINAEGEEKGLTILKNFKEELIKNPSEEKARSLISQLEEFIEIVSNGDFIPKQLFFSIKRFHRWFGINKEADYTAQAQMLIELFDTYRLFELEDVYPETRTLLYLKTVFSESEDQFKQSLKEIFKKYGSGKITKDQHTSLLSSLSVSLKLSEKEKYFLARLTYPHLKPLDSAELIEFSSEGKATTNLVVHCEDYDGVPFYIRKPVSPKEISRLHQLFLEANLLVTFKQEHEFLVAISERGFIIGGLFYNLIDSKTAHMEKIVVANNFRRKGISDRLMNDFFDRMISEKIENVTTGFFRPEYFYKFDFKVEKKYAGLAKKLR